MALRHLKLRTRPLVTHLIKETEGAQSLTGVDMSESEKEARLELVRYGPCEPLTSKEIRVLRSFLNGWDRAMEVWYDEDVEAANRMDDYARSLIGLGPRDGSM